MKTQIKVEWKTGKTVHGTISDFRPARKNAKFPDVGTALYTASAGWSERRAMHRDRAAEMGLL
jgi:hypothetical protein